ncbi:Coenzyme F420 hydrogenase/dehydrogenase, beta subunit C-terminal domain [Raoultella ornithinolytica]|uniref:Coenzyme F420 hydrogenase/dehydrogenase, beta subunit C-terminal domain n=1 Tax=Raoultella ornithinolytica TaxID=54291 RepID=UPI0021A35D69|nr:Coenzyme F420 hydrogenase/dehydrogenase, beta subunit C-terminal domain [Raoultella ornithinolytica]MCT1682168.1 Coenzyme F420 hydrogenase/dehydrogenase, beta subunit C-terminal domain [Raoultella ornithinolytica]MEB8213828.1 Coenzyme F420 hydrogenase/dehydrogenase, beta subunit C-terminal domain [Raoultella ornithinolytica]HEC2597223.1 Coenzyme F420 hydrogenase/dehydrogenase, beta subunit C-terminal domain [Raoultella ornithinolytica]
MSIDKIIKNDLCTGCGICITEDKSNTSYMDWNEDGFLQPVLTPESDINGMEKVCPFNLNNKYDEDYLAKKFLSGYTHADEDIGLYTGLYGGYSKEHRLTSSSGGLATFVFEKLLNSGAVEALFIVKEFNGRYKYQLFNTVGDIKSISKTRYYPVTLDSLFTEIKKIDGRVAVSGVACFLKAIRLKQNLYPEYKEKIPFLVGIICGGLKSRFYTDFLAQSAGCSGEYTTPEYRVKNASSFASDYKFSCRDKYGERIHVVEMHKLGDMWGTGLFKSNACDFCDDVMTELADISLGDAWIKPYNEEGLGNSVVITRSKTAHDIISSGIQSGELSLEKLNLSSVKSSQQGSFNHRHKGLLFRIKNARNSQILVPVKRKRFLSRQSLFFNLVQKQRLITRRNSLDYWKQSGSLEDFNSKITVSLTKLFKLTRLNHKFNRVVIRVKKIMRLEK